LRPSIDGICAENGSRVKAGHDHVSQNLHRPDDGDGFCLNNIRRLSKSACTECAQNAGGLAKIIVAQRRKTRPGLPIGESVYAPQTLAAANKLSSLSPTPIIPAQSLFDPEMPFGIIFSPKDKKLNTKIPLPIHSGCNRFTTAGKKIGPLQASCQREDVGVCLGLAAAS
jgi:hypothetical protein